MKLAFETGCLALMLGVACGSASSGSGGKDSPASEFITNFCAQIEPCCSNVGLSTSGATCTALTQAAASEGTFDAANGAACIAEIQREEAADTFCTTLGNDIPACNQVFASTGTVQGGQPCTQTSQCATPPGGGATCFLSVSTQDGGTTQTQTCVQTTTGQVGDGPCVGTIQPGITVYSWSGSGPPPPQGVLCSVADGLTCDGATQKCLALAGVGQPCTQDSDCITSAYCATVGSGQQCAPRLGDGSSCGNAPTGCQATLYCNPTNTSCAPQVAFGSACTVNPGASRASATTTFAAPPLGSTPSL